jgi:hypothetical protein
MARCLAPTVDRCIAGITFATRDARYGSRGGALYAPGVLLALLL